ncbi:hypothetical protein BDV93DRAFT_516042, partial [Ceratobasidium sp. AG-I]
MIKRPTILVPATSSTPVRESQPRSPDPNDRSNGPIPGRALFDTPPPNSQPAELTRDQRSRIPSARKRDQRKLSSAAPTPNAAARASTPPLSSRPRKSRKRAVVLSASDDDDDEPPRTRQVRNQGKKKSASRAESSTRGPAVAAPSPAHAPTATAPVALHPDTAATLGKLLGVDFATTTPKEFEQSIRALSDPQTQEMGYSKRYAKVRGTSPSPLPTLNKQGGYHRNRLEAHGSSGTAAKRSNSSQDVQAVKRSRNDPHDELEMDSNDKLTADPDANMSDPEGCPPLPPPVFGSQLYKQPSVSSTQGAVVNAPSSRPSRLDTAPTFHTHRPVQSLVEASMSSRGLAITPVPQPRKAGPSTSNQATLPNSQPRVRAPQAASRKDHPPPSRKPPNPSTATESETESEPSAPPAKAPLHPNTRR